MKATAKTSIILLCIMLIFLTLLPAGAFAARPISVFVDGRALVMDMPPVIRDGRTLVPFRAILTALAADLHWGAATGQISAYRSVRGESRAILLQIGSRSAWKSNSVHNITKGLGEKITLETPPVLMGNRTMVPLRFVAESFNVMINWHPETRTVNITTEIPVPPAALLPPVTQPLVTQPSAPQRQRLSSREATVRVQPAVVRIETHRSQGSGFFVSPDGLVLTNAHVVRGTRQIIVVTHTGEHFPAVITRIANWHDLALLQVNAPSHVRFPYLRDNAAAGDIPQGEEVLAFGSPLGLTGTVTRGIISAWRTKDVSLGAWSNNAIRVIQHDAAIAPGNSGGPLVNLYGEWVGINTLVRTDWAGFSFAVPAERFHDLTRRNIYDLRDDWFSYYAEAFGWHRRWNNNVLSVFNEAMRQPARSREGIDLLNRSLVMAQTLLNESARYQPLYPKIQSLRNLWLTKVDTFIRHGEYFLAVETGRTAWSLVVADRLWNDFARASNAHNVEWRRINALFQ